MAEGFKASYAGIGKMLKGPIGSAAARLGAEEVKATAEATAPVETGDYKDSFGIREGMGIDRAEAVVYNDSDHALIVEFGSGHTPRHRTLGKALGPIE